MAPVADTPNRRPSRGPGRPSRARSETIPTSTIPKKRRYIPGGPGGGGRYIDLETGKEINYVGGTGPGGALYTGPRGRVGRMNLERGVVTPQTATRPSTYSRPRRERPPAVPRSTSATAAAAAVAQNDGYKPREERGWEEFHQDLDIEAQFRVFSADEVDGRTPPVSKPPTPIKGLALHSATENGASCAIDEALLAQQGTPALNTDGSFGNAQHDDVFTGRGANGALQTPPKRRVGRPPRRLDSMLSGLGSPPAPKIVPIPSHNPKERLNLPKPSYRQVSTFESYEQDQSVGVNYVDRTLANVGYQESDLFPRPEKALIRCAEGSIEEDLDLALIRTEENAASGGTIGRVEYDMDEQDDRWLEAYNEHRREEQVEGIKPAIFEITMTQIEKEWHALEKRIPKPTPKQPQTHRPRSGSAAAVNGEPSGGGEEQDTKCVICDDGDCENTNAIVFCDGCDLAVHQECYGVPFIPEGQWLCRKCQLIGRGTPTCIFCPNIDGAFKQTNTSRWSHLLCAIWIPEVSLGNTTFMEPVMDVEKVPKQRWKLTCYICNQKMGACIQCGNKNCYAAFHVTCARRAKLFLKMKSAHGGMANLDASILKAFCDKHVPSDWRKEHDVAAATHEAKQFYRHTMRGRKWADSQQSAVGNTSAPPSNAMEGIEDSMQVDESPNKRKRGAQRRQMWRLPSGAPIVPQAVFHNVENSLIKFGIRKRKEYVAEACKYWTLKREARRGAALLKRLQLQMDTFTSMEITRRNFAGMGAAGGPRLQRRIDFAERLEDDMEQIRVLCEKAKERELMKLRDVEFLRQIVDTVYFPIPPLLWPILEKAQKYDPKGTFTEGFIAIEEKLRERYYTSVSTFSADLAAVFNQSIARATNDSDQDQGQPDGVEHSALNPEQKEKKKLAKRIIKAVQAPLEDATRKEAELGGKSWDQDVRELDALLENCLKVRRGSATQNHNEGGAVQEGTHVVNGDHPMGDADMNGINGNMEQAEKPTTNGISHEDHSDEAVIRLQLAPGEPTIPITGTDHPMADVANATGGLPTLSNSGSTNPSTTNPEPLTPPSAEQDLLAPFAHGGIPWYLEPFDPEGTTIHEERWTGREVLRDMSEELSEIDDDELDGMEGDNVLAETDMPMPDADGATLQVPKTVKKKTKRRNRW